jgi:hypothetical protein
MEIDPQRDDGRVLRAGLDDEAGIDALPLSWLTIHQEPTNKVNLPGGACAEGVRPVSLDDIWLPS